MAQADEPKKPGRPTKRTPELEAVVFGALKLGMSLRSAAEGAGINEETLRRWRNEDPEFYAQVDIAKASCRINAVDKAYRIAMNDEHDKQFDALKFWLSFRCREFQDRKDHREHAGAVELAAQIAAARVLMSRSVPEPVGGGDDRGRNGSGVDS